MERAEKPEHESSKVILLTFSKVEPQKKHTNEDIVTGDFHIDNVSSSIRIKGIANKFLDNFFSFFISLLISPFLKASK